LPQSGQSAYRLPDLPQEAFMENRAAAMTKKPPLICLVLSVLTGTGGLFAPSMGGLLLFIAAVLYVVSFASVPGGLLVLPPAISLITLFFVNPDPAVFLYPAALWGMAAALGVVQRSRGSVNTAVAAGASAFFVCAFTVFALVVKNRTGAFTAETVAAYTTEQTDLIAAALIAANPHITGDLVGTLYRSLTYIMSVFPALLADAGILLSFVVIFFSRLILRKMRLESAAFPPVNTFGIGRFGAVLFILILLLSMRKEHGLAAGVMTGYLIIFAVPITIQGFFLLDRLLAPRWLRAARIMLYLIILVVYMFGVNIAAIVTGLGLVDAFIRKTPPRQLSDSSGEDS
jgi:hypothetical protein